MYLQNDIIIAAIGKITMRSYRTGIGNEYILDPNAVDGWSDGAIVRRISTQRMNSHGDFSEPSSFGARLISFSGTAVATTRSALRAMRDNLVGVITDGSYQRLSVETMGSKRYADVGLEGTVSWVRQTDTAASFRITFYAPDPFIYGEWQSDQSGVTIANNGGLGFPLEYPLDFEPNTGAITLSIKNNGNSPSWPIFTVTGDFHSGFILTDNNGHTVEYTGQVSMGAPVSIDMAKGTATQSGVDRTINITQREWFSIPPGATISPEMTPKLGDESNGTGWCDILYRDTWI